MSRILTIKKIDGKPGEVYYPLQLTTHPKPVPGPNELLVRMHAAALNHRDFFIRQHLYPGIDFTQPLLSDGCGTVVAVGAGTPAADAAALTAKFLGRRVLLAPSRGWGPSVLGPEPPSRFAMLGSAAALPPGAGTAQDYAVVPASDVELCPPHLSAAEAAALPVVGLTAWRALVTKARGADGAALGPGANVLVTGIGGGVALAALQFARALGCNVFVTSGSAAKLARATAPPPAGLGAAGGVSYRDDGWERALAAQLPAARPYLDAVIDGAGGDIVARTVRLLRPGGVIASYGMTLGPRMDFSMQAVLKNIEVRGSTMGSRVEFRDMIEFVRQRGIRPVVSRVVKGLDDIAAIDGLFEEIRDGKQFGKLVIEISPEDGPGAKL